MQVSAGNCIFVPFSQIPAIPPSFSSLDAQIRCPFTHPVEKLNRRLHIDSQYRKSRFSALGSGFLRGETAHCEAQAD